MSSSQLNIHIMTLTKQIEAWEQKLRRETAVIDERKIKYDC